MGPKGARVERVETPYNFVIHSNGRLVGYARTFAEALVMCHEAAVAAGWGKATINGLP